MREKRKREYIGTSGGRKRLHGAVLHADGENPGEMDYNHLKALILNRSLLEDEKRLGNFLGIWKRKIFFRGIRCFCYGG